MQEQESRLGRFISLEGGEGTGKSTQIQHLGERLKDVGYDVVTTREPGGTPLGEQLRTLLLKHDAPPRCRMAEALLFYAARADHLDQVICPAIKRGAWVVTDRFSDSTLAYQGAAGKLPVEVLKPIDEAVVGPSKPDLTIIMDLDPSLGLQRAAVRARDIGIRATDCFESENLQFHQELRDAFLEIAFREPERCVVVDASASEAEVEVEIWRIVCERLRP